MDTVDYVYNGANQVKCVDADNSATCNGAEFLWVYDAYGNLLNDGATTYTYDAANRLKTVTASGVTTSYVYNGDGDRVSQTVGAVTTTYVIDPAPALTTVLSETTGAATTRYLYGLDLAAQNDGANTRYLEYDGLGSVRQLTDSTGVVNLAQTFDPYGNGYSSAGTAATNYGYTGEQKDSDGLLNLRARYYNPQSGQFFQTDPSGFERNLYQYAGSNPVRYADPDGQCLIPGDPNFDADWAPLGQAKKCAGTWDEDWGRVGKDLDRMGRFIAWVVTPEGKRTMGEMQVKGTTLGRSSEVYQGAVLYNQITHYDDYYNYPEGKYQHLRDIGAMSVYSFDIYLQLISGLTGYAELGTETAIESIAAQHLDDPLYLGVDDFSLFVASGRTELSVTSYVDDASEVMLSKRASGSMGDTGVKFFDRLAVDTPEFQRWKANLEARNWIVEPAADLPDARADTGLLYDVPDKVGIVRYGPQFTYLDMLHESRHVVQLERALSAQRAGIIGPNVDLFSQRFRAFWEYGAYGYETRLGTRFGFYQEYMNWIERQPAELGWDEGLRIRFGFRFDTINNRLNDVFPSGLLRNRPR